jgi:hypothetical protein
VEKVMSKTNSPADERSIDAFRAFGLVLLDCAAALSPFAATAARSQDRIKAGLQIWKSSGCADCHGPFADGDPEDGDCPIGANLRTTRLDTAGLKSTISCGVLAQMSVLFRGCLQFIV